MSKDKKITQVYTVEITVSGWSENEKYFTKVATEQIKETRMDIVSAHVTEGSASVKTKKVKIIDMKQVSP